MLGEAWQKGGVRRGRLRGNNGGVNGMWVEEGGKGKMLGVESVSRSADALVRVWR